MGRMRGGLASAGRRFLHLLRWIRRLVLARLYRTNGDIFASPPDIGLSLPGKQPAQSAVNVVHEGLRQVAGLGAEAGLVEGHQGSGEPQLGRVHCLALSVDWPRGRTPAPPTAVDLEQPRRGRAKGGQLRAGPERQPHRDRFPPGLASQQPAEELCCLPCAHRATDVRRCPAIRTRGFHSSRGS